VTGRSARLRNVVLVALLAALAALAVLLPAREREPARTESQAEPNAVPEHVPPAPSAADPSPAPSSGASADPLDEAAARRVYESLQSGPECRFDPLAILRPQPDLEQGLGLAEHPAGRLVYRTNADGLREDGPTPVRFEGVRVLVGGDSHTYGVADNRDTFPNVLERLLGEADPARAYDVVNAGVPYTGPFCYLGTLRKFLHLRPAVFVAAVFLGNDFWNDMMAGRAIRGELTAGGGEEYAARLQAVPAAWNGPLWQGFNQAYRFKRFPAEATEALEQVLVSCERMQALCTESGIRFVVLLVPTKADVDLGDDRETWRGVCALLELTPQEAGFNRTLGERLAAGLRERGIEHIDPTQAMIAAEEPLYWRFDHHLSVAGHALLGRTLFEALAEGARAGSR